MGKLDTSNLVWAIISFCAALGFQVSGFTNVPLAIVLWITSAVLAAYTLREYAPAIAKVFNRSRIEWNYKGFLAATGGMNQETGGYECFITRFQCMGQNLTGRAIKSVSGHIESIITGQQHPICLVVNGELVKPEQTNGIPSEAMFSLAAPFRSKVSGKDQMPIDVFEDEFATFKFVFHFDGRKYKKTFSRKEVKALIDKIQGPLRSYAVPKVTLR